MNGINMLPHIVLVLRAIVAHDTSPHLARLRAYRVHQVFLTDHEVQNVKYWDAKEFRKA